jgi:hypothetical protein
MPAATEYGDYAQWEFERRYLLRALPPELDRDRGPRTRLTDLYIHGTRFRVREHRNLHNEFCVMKLGQKFPARDGEYGRIVIPIRTSPAPNTNCSASFPAGGS